MDRFLEPESVIIDNNTCFKSSRGQCGAAVSPAGGSQQGAVWSCIESSRGQSAGGSVCSESTRGQCGAAVSPAGGSQQGAVWSCIESSRGQSAGGSVELQCSV